MRGTRGAATDMSTRAQNAGVSDAGAALLRGGTLCAIGVGVLGVVVSAWWGVHGAAGFATGAVLATAALAVGPLLLHATRAASPPAVTMLAGGGYAGVVVLLGVVFLALEPVTWLSASHVAAALVAVTIAGLAGQIRAVTRLRVLVFGSLQDNRDETRDGLRDDDGAQSSQQAGR
jgi:hypothetical protein